MRMKYAGMTVTKVKQQWGWHKAKSLSVVAMVAWARSPEQGCVKRLETLSRRAHKRSKRCGCYSSTVEECG